MANLDPATNMSPDYVTHMKMRARMYLHHAADEIRLAADRDILISSRFAAVRRAEHLLGTVEGFVLVLYDAHAPIVAWRYARARRALKNRLDALVAWQVGSGT